MYTVRIFIKCRHVYQFFTKLKIEPDFSSLSDELAKQRPDMNIKATAFTVSENSINTWSEKYSMYVLFAVEGLVP